jgi:hypothetical protein
MICKIERILVHFHEETSRRYRFHPITPTVERCPHVRAPTVTGPWHRSITSSGVGHGRNAKCSDAVLVECVHIRSTFLDQPLDTQEIASPSSVVELFVSIHGRFSVPIQK